MDNQDNHVTLFCSQTKDIARRIRDGEVLHVKTKFIREKYGDVSHIFMTVYDWYVKRAEEIVPRPEGAESGIWAFVDLKLLDRDDRCSILELSVPIERAIFFRMSDWNKILNLRYLGGDDGDSQQFAEKAAKYGVRDESDLMMKPFYPQFKQEIIYSWRHLFRYDDAIKRGEVAFPDIQAGLWEIHPEWVEDWDR